MQHIDHLVCKEENGDCLTGMDNFIEKGNIDNSASFGRKMWPGLAGHAN
jgi:hypothetical protein